MIQFCPKGHDTFIQGRTKQHGCKQCWREYAKEYWYTNKERLETYNKLFKEQNGLCLGCYKHQTNFKKRFSVDHCHKTKKVRGLLCNACNFAIGLVHDNPETLIRLAAYLNKHKENYK